MGVVLVVLPDTEFRRGLCRELDRRGMAAIAVCEWSTAIDVASARPIEAVVFDSERDPLDGGDWRRGLERLRAAHPGIVPLPLGATQPNPTQPNPPGPATASAPG
jgi:ActR/RegA family two-component response regulator